MRNLPRFRRTFLNLRSMEQCRFSAKAFADEFSWAVLFAKLCAARNLGALGRL